MYGEEPFICSNTEHKEFKYQKSLSWQKGKISAVPSSSKGSDPTRGDSREIRVAWRDSYNSFKWMKNQFVNKVREKMISSMLATEPNLEFLKQIFFFVTPLFIISGLTILGLFQILLLFCLWGNLGSIRRKFQFIFPFRWTLSSFGWGQSTGFGK